jgi:hypothetical protein
MLKDVVQVEAVSKHRLRLRFEDGLEGIVDLSKAITFTGVFEPLTDEAYFRQVRVLPEYGTIGWPNGADLDPHVLYSLVRESPPPSYGP